ncbi:long-chain fatty acid--CoA ligase [Phenylobacterium sp.]|uniref:acyl-CoA synthetase n=1 Tax=Phenylobacterium sp. TaxID=1871053 RepID=UPI0026026871|nr:long-chain fatty acid--CoA ligase [Phenylobacterium sp.]
MLLSDVPAIAAHHAPDVIALRLEDRTWTYAELRDRCWRLSNALIRVTEPGDRVAILSENCPEYVECYYGVPGAGLALVFLNYRLAARELAYIIGNSEPRLLFVERRYLPAIREIRGEIPSVEQIVVIGEQTEDAISYDALLATGAASEPLRRPKEDELCWLLYTSGTTGLPKGAMLSHRNIMAAITNSMCSWEAAPDDVCLFTFPLFHVAGYVMPMYHLRTYPVVLLRSFDIETLLANIERHRVTSTAMAPTMIAMLLENPVADRYDISSLRRIGYGASAMPAEVLRRARGRWPGVAFSTGFGMTELSGNVMFLSPADHDRAADQGLDILRSVGRQMPLARVRVVDDEGRDAPADTPGEIVVKGDQVLMGYWRNPEATRSSFFAGGWFRSGDVGRWDADGYLYIVDRKKDMILTGGENVYPREVEEVLYQHPAVVEAAVIGAPDPKWGEKVVAVVCLRTEASADELIAFCRERIASYKKPRHVVFIEALPRNASGKVLKRELRERITVGELALGEPQSFRRPDAGSSDSGQASASGT